MSSEWLIDLSHVTQRSGIYLSIVSNAALLFLILKKSSASFGAYKYIMIAYSIFEILYSTGAFVSAMAFHSTTYGYVLFRKIDGLGESLARILLLSFCFFYFSLLVFLLVHFVYRYCVLCKTSHLWLFRGAKLCYWILSCLVGGTFGTGLKYFYFSQSSTYTEKMRNEFVELYNISMEEIVYNGPFLHNCDDNDVNCHHPMSTWIVVFLLMTYFMSICGAMIYLGFLTYVKLSEYRSVRSDKMLRLQRQLWRALIVQTANPMLFMYLPILITYTNAMLRISVGSYSNLSMIPFSIYPPLDQLLIIFIIKDFRNYVKEVFCGVVHRIKKPSSQNNHTNPTELENI